MSYLDELQKATNRATTENGGATNASTLNPCLDFFALGASKRNDIESAVRLFAKAYAKDKTTALRTLFYIRDIRGGQGERDIFRACMKELSAIDPAVADNMLEFIPEYGRWDDLLYHRAANGVAVKMVKEQLEKDMKAFKDGPISLLAKWMPSENASSEVTKKAAQNWAKSLGLKPSQYRKMLSKLRAKIDILERKMSDKKWMDIKYEAVPSQAFRKHTKAFDRNDHDRYQEFIGAVNKGEKKVNTSTVTTAEVIQNVRSGDNDSANAIWKSLDNFVPEDLNAIVVADVSGSMYGRPMDISTSLALYFAERNKGYFANKFMTFSHRPHLVDVVGDTLTEKLRNISTADWDMNTNVEAAFDALLAAAKNSGDLENVPKVIYIISDMEFDSCVSGADETAFENARRKWSEAGLELPTVVFWNVDARSNNTPATKFDKNVALVSGSNQSAFRFAMEGKTPEDLMNEVVNSERYAQIVL